MKGTKHNAMKGALLSGLVFPGLGQVAFKHYKRGAALVLAVLAGLVFMAVKSAQRALVILQEGGASVSTVSKAATQALAVSDDLAFHVAWLLILLCWAVGVVDAYRIGRQKDLEERSAKQVSHGGRG
jgi:DMSO reductase anchor subunit